MSRERSEEEGEGATMMRLLEESRVKDLALEKASRLIDLLTVEVKFRRQSYKIRSDLQNSNFGGLKRSTRTG